MANLQLPTPPDSNLPETPGIGGPGGTFDGEHNDLDGRDASGAHPISAIEELDAALAALNATTVVKASVVLAVPSLTPDIDDTIYWVEYEEGLAPDAAGLYNWRTRDTITYTGTWVDNNDPTNVMLLLPGDWFPTAVAEVVPGGFEPITVLGGTVVSLACGGGGPDGSPALWQATNIGNGVGNATDPTQPVMWFEPSGMAASRVRTRDREGFLSGAGSTLEDKLARIDDIDLGGAETEIIRLALYAPEEVDLPDLATGLAVLAMYGVTAAIPEGTPLGMYASSDGHTYRVVRNGIAYDAEADPSIFWTAPEQMDTQANDGKLIMGRGLGGSEDVYVRIVTHENDGTPVVWAPPLTTAQRATVEDMIGDAISSIDLSGFATTTALGSEATARSEADSAEATARSSADGELAELIADLESGKLSIEAFEAEMLKRPQMVTHWSYIVDHRYQTNPQIDGRTRNPCAGITGLLDLETGLHLRTLDPEYSGPWLMHVNAGYGEVSDPDGDFAWWQRPPGVYIPGKGYDGVPDPETTDPLAEDFAGVTYYDGDLRFPRPPELYGAESDYHYGTYYSTIQWSNFLAFSRKGNVNDTLMMMLEYGGEYVGVPQSSEIREYDAAPTLGPLGPSHADRPLAQYKPNLWLVTVGTGHPLYSWKIDTQEWVAVTTLGLPDALNRTGTETLDMSVISPGHNLRNDTRAVRITDGGGGYIRLPGSMMFPCFIFVTGTGSTDIIDQADGAVRTVSPGDALLMLTVAVDTFEFVELATV